MSKLDTPALLEPLIQEAEKKGLWLETTYQAISFSPKELRENLANGRFLWGPVNWRLINPESLMRDEPAEFAKIKKYNQSIAKRMNK